MEYLKDINPREYQKQIFETCTKENCLVVLPTGLGKTLISIMVTIDRMKKFPGQKVLFLAPTKPLAEQQLHAFKKTLGELFAGMEIFTGALNATKRKKLWQTGDIVFSTPQCIANDLKKELYNLKEVCLLIEDEAHRCVKNYDYNFVAAKYISQGENQRIIGLTASPGSETQKIKEICKNLNIKKVELRTRESPDVKEYLKTREFEKVEVEFPPSFQEIKHVLEKLINGYVEELKRRNVLFGPSNKTSLIQLQKKISGTLSRGNRNYNYMLGASACAQAIKLHHALDLLETQTLEGFNKYLKEIFSQASKKQSKGVVKLVSKPEFNFIFMQSNELLAKNIEHPKVEKIKEIVKKEFEKKKIPRLIVFTQFRETATKVSKNLNSIENVKAKTFLGQAQKNGTGLSQKKQKEIIEEFKNGEINILVATSIGEEGLDIPEVDAVIFYEPVPSAIRLIQRAGRTARLTKGKLIVLVTKKTKDESFFYVSRSREKKMSEAIETIQKNFDNNKNTKEEKQEKL